MNSIEDKMEMITNITNEILANGLADSRIEAQKMAEEWVETLYEDIAF